MTAAEVTEALRLLKIPQATLAVWLDDMDPRSVRRFCNDGAESGKQVKPVDVHPALALLVRLMLARLELRDVIEGIALGEAGPIALTAMPGGASAEKPKRARKARKDAEGRQSQAIEARDRGVAGDEV